MNKRILLGVDSTISPATQQALLIMSEFIQQAAPQLRLVLLNVIPLPSIASPAPGMYAGPLQPLTVTPEQHAHAEAVLGKARSELQKQGVTSSQIEVLVRVGIPAYEIVKAARELRVDFIVVGCRGNSPGHHIRRFFAGSTSRKVLHTAPCPVMIVSPPPLPKTAHPTDLVRWYQESITSYLHEHTSALTVFTPLEVVQIFAPQGKKKHRRKEIAAATLALEQLAREGVLCRHEVKGELRYIND
jgi:nucleotide-binding universal stress UspA family protein